MKWFSAFGGDGTITYVVCQAFFHFDQCYVGSQAELCFFLGVKDSSETPGERGRRARLLTRTGVDVVTVVVGLNLLVFGYMTSLERDGLASFIDWGAISFWELERAGWWQPFTHLFLHGGMETWVRALHMGLNMVVIYQVGKELLLDVGTKHWLGIFFISGILGGFFQVLMTPSRLLGASGAAFGLMTAYGSIHARESLEAWVLGLHVKVNGGLFRLALILSSAFLGVLVLAGVESIPLVSNMGHFAHLGGALGGVIYVRLAGLVPQPLSRSKLLEQRVANDARLEAQRTSHQA